MSKYKTVSRKPWHRPQDKYQFQCHAYTWATDRAPVIHGDGSIDLYGDWVHGGSAVGGGHGMKCKDRDTIMEIIDGAVSPEVLAARKKLEALEAAEAKKHERLADQKAKRELAKLLKGLSPAGKRAVLWFRSHKDAFGCQRLSALELIAAVTGDDPAKIAGAVNQ